MLFGNHCEAFLVSCFVKQSPLNLFQLYKHAIHVLRMKEDYRLAMSTDLGLGVNHCYILLKDIQCLVNVVNLVVCMCLEL